MTKKTIMYLTRDSMKFDKTIQAQRKFRSIHTHIIQQGFEVIYDNTPDPPPPPKRRLTETAFIRELAQNSDIELI